MPYSADWHRRQSTLVRLVALAAGWGPVPAPFAALVRVYRDARRRGDHAGTLTARAELYAAIA